MDTGTWLGFAALVVAIVAIPVTVFATRHWGNRRARLDVAIDAIPLLPEGMQPGLLEVTYRDIPVSAPHLVTVTFWNSGPRDLASDMFDNGRSIAVRFDQTFYGLTAVNGGVQTRSPAVGARADEAIVFVRPALLKRGSSWSFSAVTTGPVEVNVDAPLIDTDVRATAPSDASGTEITLRLSALGMTAEVPLRWGPGRR